MAAVEALFFYLLALASCTSLAALNAALGGLTLFFLYRLATGRWRPGLPALLLLAFFGWTAVAALASPRRDLALPGVLHLWSWTALLTASALPEALRERLGRFGAVMGFSAFAAAAAAAAEFVRGAYRYDDLLHPRGRALADPAAGFFSHHLTFGGVLSVAGFFLAGLLLYTNLPWKTRWPWAAGTLSACAGLVTSLTRTYWLAALPAAACLLWGKGRRWVAGGGLAAALAAALLLAAGPEALRARALSTFDASNASNAERIYLWISGLHMWRDRPLLGWGPDTYPALSPPYRAPYAQFVRHPGAPAGFETTSHAHNLYLMIALHSGAVGLLLFLAFAGATLRALARHPDPRLRYGLLAAFAAFLAGGFFEFNGGDAEVATLLFFLLGLGLAGTGRAAP